MPATLTAPPVVSSVIDIEHDDTIPVRQLVKERTGKTISPACLWRWIRKGVRGHRLEAVQVLGVWHTTPEAYAIFVAGQTRAALGDDAPTSAPAPRTAEKTERLKRAGLLRD